MIENDMVHFEVKLASNEREKGAESQFLESKTNNKHGNLFGKSVNNRFPVLLPASSIGCQRRHQLWVVHKITVNLHRVF